MMISGAAALWLLTAQQAPAVPPAPAGDQAPVPVPVPAPAPAPATDAPAPAQAAPGPAFEDDIIVEAQRRSPADPLSAVNVKVFEVTTSVDKAVTGPIAMGYKHDIPSPVRSGLRNFFGNLNEPVIFVNFLLQLKPGKAAETAGRFVVNSTIGGAGLFDVAKRKPFKLPHRNNGFADTMGYYGIGPGPFFYFPIVGPTTLRDAFGNVLDSFAVPLAVGTPFNQLYYIIPSWTIRAIDNRAEFDDKIRELRSKRDPYVATRKYYLTTRQAEIDHLRGRDRVTPETPPAPAPQQVPQPAPAPAPLDPPAAPQ